MGSHKSFEDLNLSSFPVSQTHSVTWQKKLREMGGMFYRTTLS